MLKRIWLMLCIVGMVTANPIYAADNTEEDVTENVTVSGFRYWFDGNTEEIQDVAVASDAITTDVLKQSVAIPSTLEQGKHSLSYQIKGSDNTFSPVHLAFFYISDNPKKVDAPEVASSIKEYAYWFEDHYPERKTQAFDKADISITETLSEYTPGRYTIYYTAVTEAGERGFGCKNFILSSDAGEDEQEDNSVAKFQYWVDGDISKMMETSVQSSDFDANLSINYADLGLDPGKHILSYHAVSNNGEWGKIHHAVFFISDDVKPDEKETEKSDIVGYRMGFGNGEIEQESIDATREYPVAVTREYDIYQLASPRPNAVTFDESKGKAYMSTTTQVTYFIQFQNKQGAWSAPVWGAKNDSETITSEIKSLEVNKSAYVENLKQAEFEVFKVVLDKKSHKMSTLNNCSVALYKDKTYQENFAISADGFKESTWEAGTYYAVVYNLPSPGSFRISSSDKKIPDNPKIEYNQESKMVKLSSTQEGAAIYYTTDDDESNPTVETATLYTEPFPVDDNYNIKAVAVMGDDYAYSHVVSYRISSFDMKECNEVTFKFDGHTLTMETKTTGASIYYTTNKDAEPNTPYDEKGIVLTEITNIWAIAKKKNMLDSQITNYTTPSVYDGVTVTVGEAGNLNKAFDWCNRDTVANLVVKGSLNADDVASLKNEFSHLFALEMTEAEIVNKTLADQALANLQNLVVAYLPKSLTDCGKEIFNGCKSLATVYWRAESNMPSGVLDKIGNPNLLLYVNRKQYAPTDYGNVVCQDGTLATITLSDVGETSTSYGNFYCPEAFEAATISYTRTFNQETAAKGSTTGKGWETIVLPFTVSSITHSEKGVIKPFGAWENSGSNDPNSDYRPFWLCNYSGSEFKDAVSIQAGVPYIIAMPNNEAYADKYNLNGEITFSATNAQVSATPLENTSAGKLIPCYIYTPGSSNILSLNIGEGTEPGSMFETNGIDVKPFEAYIPYTSVNTSRLSIGDYMGGTTGIFEIPTADADGAKAWIDGNILYLQAANATRVNIYTVGGVLCKSVQASSEPVAVTGLKAGVYIVNKKKLVIK